MTNPTPLTALSSAGLAFEIGADQHLVQTRPARRRQRGGLRSTLGWTRFSWLADCCTRSAWLAGCQRHIGADERVQPVIVVASYAHREPPAPLAVQ